jgi:hypothetical protein
MRSGGEVKKEFKVGDRVRVYGQLLGDVEVSGHKARIVENCETFGPPNGWLTITFERGGREYRKHVHPKQCRRLVKKPKKPTQERVKATIQSQGDYYQFLSAVRGEKVLRLSQTFDPRCPRHLYYLVEVKPGEVVVNRDALAKAWDELVGGMRSSYDKSATSTVFIEFCKSLGLTKEGEK